MGWLSNPRWKSKQEVLDLIADDIRSAGYSVETDGNWLYAEKDGKPVDLIYCIVNKEGGEWGYKEVSVACGPYCYTAPLRLVLKVHPIFRNNEYYIGWLEKYPKRKAVYQSESNEQTASLFSEVA